MVGRSGYAPGRYVFRYEGEGRFRFHLDGRLISHDVAAKRAVVEVTPKGPGVWLYIEETDPRGIGDHLRNMSFVKEEHVARHDAGQIFHPDQIEFLQDFRVLRFMEWVRANELYNPAKPMEPLHWGDRRRVDHFTYEDDVPVEIMIALANQIGADPWFSLPFNATDHYFTSFAILVRDQLDPDLSPYFEYSNETWNSLYPSYHWTYAKGVEKFGANAPFPESQYVGLRVSQLADILASVFASMPDRDYVKVVGVQAGLPYRSQYILDPPNMTAQDGAPPYTKVDAYAVAAYFGSFAFPQWHADMRNWLRDSDGGFRRAFREAEFGDQFNTPGQTFPLDYLAEVIEDNAAVAARYGLDLIAYEGGQHVVGLNGVLEDNELTEFFKAMNRHQEMGRLYRQLFDIWAEHGDLFVHFNSVGMWTKWGSFPLVETLDELTPKYHATAERNRYPPDWHGNRATHAFANGYFILDEGRDDILRGGAGRDTFVLRGADRAIGEEGRDIAIVPGRLRDYRLERDGDVTRVISSASGQLFATLEGIETVKGAAD
jgi:hypothetical protein